MRGIDGDISLNYLISLGNPVITSKGGYIFANLGQAIGPGFVTVELDPFLASHLTYSKRCGIVFRYELGNRTTPRTVLFLRLESGVSLPNRTNPDDDEIRIQDRVQKIRTYWNSHYELNDAMRYLSQGDIKATVRSAAASVNAALIFYSCEWNVPFPHNNQQFNQKIETFLSNANRASYKAMNRKGSLNLLRLYQARNAQHEGDVYYKDHVTKKNIRIDQVTARKFLEEAMDFLLWLDAQA